MNDLVLNEGEDDDFLRQLLDEFEGVYALMKAGEIDDEVFYQLLSFYVERIFDGKQKPTAREYIKDSRDEARNDSQIRPDEIYRGIELLYDKVKRMAINRPPEPNKI